MTSPTPTTTTLAVSHSGLHNFHIDVAGMFGTTAQAIKDAVAAASAAGGASLYFGNETWTITTSDLSYTDIGLGTFYTNSGFLVRVPSNTTFYGPGTIRMTNVPDEGVSASPWTNHYAVFAMGGGESNIRFEGLTFEGDNDPFVIYDRNQSAAIRVYSDSLVSNVEIVGCNFRNLHGFAVQAEGTVERVSVRECVLEEVGNTINNNSDYGTIENCTFTNVGGTECSGIGVRVHGNTFQVAHATAISIGGRTAVDAVGVVRGVEVTDNTVLSCTDQGITIGDGIRGALIDGNVLTRCDEGAIAFTHSTGYNPTDCMISNNLFYGNCEIGVATTAVILGTGGRHHFVGNVIWEDTSTSSYWQQHGVDVFGTDCVVEGNVIESTDRFGTSKCVSVGAVANVIMGANRFLGAKAVEIGGTATVDTEYRYGRVAADIIYEQRKSNGSGAFWRWLLDGTLRWGDGTNNTDVDLSRTAANTLTLATGDTFRLVGSVHASLPAATSFAAGAQYYCTTDKQPLWSDGTNWVEADGTNH